MSVMVNGQVETEEKIDPLYEAIKLADKIRRDHNGIMSVKLHLGHDGNNECDLADYGQGEGKPDNYANGNSGYSMLEAVQRAYGNWRFARLMTSNFRNEAMISCILAAIESSGDSSGDLPYSGLVFTTQAFNRAINSDQSSRMSHDQVTALLGSYARVVKLAEANQWLLLPDGRQREL